MSGDYESEFKEKARKHLFNCNLRVFPVAFEMYTRAFDLTCNLDNSMAEIIRIVRTSKDTDTAYTLVCQFLDSLEGA